MFLQLSGRFIGLHNAGGKRCGKCAKPCVEKGTAGCAPIIFCVNLLIFLPSLDKGRHGFGGQKCAHTASSPLTIRQVFSAGLFSSGHISAPTKLLAPASDVFSSDFWFLRRGLAGASQGEKGKKRRKDTLSGVFALVNRWYSYRNSPGCRRWACPCRRCRRSGRRGSR